MAANYLWHKEGLHKAGREMGLFNRYRNFLIDIGYIGGKKQIMYLSKDHKHFPFCLLKSRCDNETGGGNINPPKTPRVFSQEVSNDCHWICCSACFIG